MNRPAYKGTRDGEGMGMLIAGIIIIGIVVAIVIAAAMVIFYTGAAVGAWYSIRNYLRSFKVNVIDSNRMVAYA